MNRLVRLSRPIVIGLNTAGRAGINACGVGTVVPMMKQEKECPDVTSGQKPQGLPCGASLSF
ncbi:MAG TPA: hypothetical protein VMW39_04440 [bacterium]|nr:hypothetical protein [bacterium]